MAINIVVMPVNPSPFPPNPGVDGGVSVSVIGDYQCPAPFQTQIYIPFKGASSEKTAVEMALKTMETISDQMREGVQRAIQSRPPGA